MLIALLVVSATLVLVGYGWLEAGWLRTRVLEVALDGLPEALDGITIGHLSDFHLGAPFSRGNRASEQAARWVGQRRPDLVCITGDLVSHPRGVPRLQALLARLERPLVVLGNHDVAVTRDPFSRAAELRGLERTTLLRDDSEVRVLRGERVLVVGVDPVTYQAKQARPDELADEEAAFRLLLCHFPRIVDRIPCSSFDLILTGHLHAGQISLPVPGRRVTLAHPQAEFVSGLYDTDAGRMHVSPGTGTTFVPLRFFSRPEVTELVLRRRN
jgi:predicted MPP superfamily phosphohydrolase